MVFHGFSSALLYADVVSSMPYSGCKRLVSRNPSKEYGNSIAAGVVPLLIADMIGANRHGSTANWSRSTRPQSGFGKAATCGEHYSTGEAA